MVIAIIIDGKVYAYYCRHCGIFGLGKNAHSTKDHKGSLRYAYRPASREDAANSDTVSSKAGMNLATFPSEMKVEDVPVVDSLAPGTGFCAPCAPANYDLGIMPSLNLAMPEPDEADEDDLWWLSLNLNF